MTSLALLSLASGLAGCPAGPASASRELRVLAAASLTEPLRALGAAFEGAHPDLRVLVSVGGSTALEQQVAAGARVDVFVSAAEAPVERLLRRGLLDPGTRTIVARGELVVIAPVDAVDPPRALEDLRRLARVAVGQPGVPVGDYAREALGRAGLGPALEGKLAGYPDEPAVLSAVAAGAAPAGIVYTSSLVAHPRREAVARALAVDPALHAPVVYTAAVGAESTAPAVARAFLAFLQGDAGRAALRAAGFAPGDPPAGARPR